MTLEFRIYASKTRRIEYDGEGGEYIDDAETLRKAERKVGEHLHEFDHFVIVQLVYHYNSRLSRRMYPKIRRLIMRINVFERR